MAPAASTTPTPLPNPFVRVPGFRVAVTAVEPGSNNASKPGFTIGRAVSSRRRSIISIGHKVAILAFPAETATTARLRGELSIAISFTT